MRAVMVSGELAVGFASAEIWGFFCVGDRVMSRSSHQSSSVTSCIPDAVNHCLFRSGTKKWTFGCFALIFMIVGWSIWS